MEAVVQQEPEFTRKDGALAGVAALGAFVLYLRTLCPTVYLGDSGEICTAIATGGVVHPPGYPLFSLLGRTALFLPFGEPAYRIGLMVALFAALAVGVVFLLARALKASPWAAFGAAGLYAAGSTFWSQSVRVEVYSLHVLLAGLILLGALRYRGGGRPGWLALAVTAGSLGVAHHLTIVLLAPAALRLVAPRLLAERGSGGRRLLPLLMLPVGPALYLLLIWWAQAEPLQSWGHPVSIPLLLTHASARSYRVLLHVPDLPALKAAAERTWVYFADSFPYLTGALPLLGLLGLWRRERATAAAMGLAAGAVLAYNACYRIPDIAPYYLTAWLVCAALSALGLEALRTALRSSGASPVVAGALLLFVVAAPLLRNWDSCNLSRITWAREFARHKLASVDRGGVLLTQGDTDAATVWYVQDVLGERRDVFHLNRPILSAGCANTGWDSSRWYLRRVRRQGLDLAGVDCNHPGGEADDHLLLRLLEGPLRDRPLFLTFRKSRSPADSGLRSLFTWAEGRYLLEPQGMVTCLRPSSSPRPLPSLLAMNERLWAGISLPEQQALRTDQEMAPNYLFDHYARMLVGLGALHEQAGRRAAAVRTYRDAVTVAPWSVPAHMALEAVQPSTAHRH